MTQRPLKTLLRLTAALASLVLLAVPVSAAGPNSGDKPGHPKLDSRLQQLSALGAGDSRVIVELQDNAPAGLIRALGGVEGRRLRAFKGQVARINNRQLLMLAQNPWVKSVHEDRATSALMNLTALVVGARTVRSQMGYDGAGVGVAIIDSGITGWHDDLMGTGIGGQKEVQFVDFVNQLLNPYDDNGHGTHVAGIIAGSGYESYGAKAGIAPGARLVSLKVLDASGAGHISDMIAAIDWVVENHAAYNIRVVNLSVGASVTESYLTDPLTLAVKRAVDAGVVVVAAAGNVGRNAAGQIQYGGITAPGNAPWVLTVGASSHMGTLWRGDDTVAGYSSRGPTAKDFLSKPDLVAPGTGIVSLSDPTSLFYSTKSAYLVAGARATSYKPYLSLSGTSMAAPVVAGSVALMLQANPALTPNAVKAILEYTAQNYAQYDHLTQGVGFLNTKGAVELARFFRHARPGDRFPLGKGWSRHIIWGNHLLGHGMILPTGNAWAANVVWGASRGANGDNIVWGAACRAGSDCENIVWGNTAQDGENLVWGASADASADNIVWGASTDGSADNIVWGASADAFDNIVWGNSFDSDNLVWGADCGGADCDNIVWGASVVGADGENIVWGASADVENIVWGASGDTDNIVWGASADDENIVWGASGDDNIVWGASGPDSPTVTDPDDTPLFDPGAFDVLFDPIPLTTTSSISTVTGGF